MVHIYLDDYRDCPRGFQLAKNAEECIMLLKDQSVDTLSLDFDLGWSQPTGYEVVQYLIQSGSYPKDIYLHTSSAAGRMQMYHALSKHAPIEIHIHNGPVPPERLAEIANSI